MKKVLTFFGLSLLAFSGMAQTAVSLPGTSDKVETTYDFDLTNGFTIEYRMYMHTLQDWNSGISKGSGAIAGPIDTYVNAGGTFTVFVGNGTASNAVTVNGMTAGQWHHYAVTVAPTGAYVVYIDGVEADNSIHPGIANSANPMIIGDRDDLATNSNADYDNIRVWSGVRTPEEIFAYKDICLVGTEADLEILYQCETGSGTTVADLATNDGAQDGTILNGGTWSVGQTCGTYNCVISDQTITQADYNVICKADTIVELASSEVGLTYFLTDATNGDVVGSPLTGTGSALNWNTGEVMSTTTYEIVAKGFQPDYGVDLPQSNDFVQFANPNTSYSDAITVEAWVNGAAGVQAWAGQSTSLVDNMTENVWLWHSLGTEKEWRVNDNGVWDELNFPAMPAGWTHVATVADASGMYIYYDGVLVASNANGITGGMINNVNSVIEIGQDPRYSPGTSLRNTNVAFDDFRVWNVARTQDQIANNMTCISGAEAGLVQHTSFDEASGTAITSNVGSDGIIMNPSTNWVSGSGACTSCSITISDDFTITIDPIAEQTITQADYDACGTDDPLVSLASTQAGVNYYLRDNADNSVVDGPVLGTGGAIDLNGSTITNTTTYNVYATAAPKTALDFDGNDDLVDLGNQISTDLTGSTTITVEANVKAANTLGLGVVVGNYAYPTNANELQFMIRRSGDHYQFYIDPGTGYQHLDTPPGSVAVGEWQHVAGTWDGTTTKVYLDGVEVASTTAITGAGLITTSNSCVMGNNAINEEFTGVIDEVRIWNTTRTAGEISSNMTTCLSGNETGLVALYGMTDASGTTVTDLSGNANDGIMMNMDPATDWVTEEICTDCELELADQLTVTINPLPTVDAGTDQTECENTMVTLNGAGAVTYAWDNAVTDGVAFTAPNGTTTYTVTGTDANGCQNTDMVDVTINALPTVDAGTNVEQCDGAGDVTLSGTGNADTYTWDNGITDGVAFTPSVGTTTYMVTGEITATGCQTTDVVDVIVNALPTVDAGVDTTLCENATYTLSGAGADTYVWDNGVTDGVAFNVGAAATTIYTVTGTDANGCEDTDMVEIITVAGPTITAVITDELVGSDGAIDVTVTGGSGTFDFTWSNAETTEDISGLVGGTYTLTVDDGNCALDSTFTVLSSVGVEENTLTFNLYPNPTNAEVTVEFSQGFDAALLNLTDASGKLVLSTTIAGNKTQLNLSEFENGIYFMTVTAGDQQMVKRIIKQ
ncbi:MAG: LamG-like jellyroll fold domain-containing protein [Crocinitomicaceae bacterium]